jgi:MSHA pilin protein MshC
MARAHGTRSHARRSTHSGFTIIELIATIAILAIVASLSLPSFTTAAPFAARGYADEIGNALRQARNVAIASSCEAQFTVNAAGYQATQRTVGANNTCNPAGAFTSPIKRGDGRDLAGWPPSSANVTAPRSVVFSANGTVSGAVPAPISVPPFTITIDAGGWVEIQ